MKLFERVRSWGFNIEGISKDKKIILHLRSYKESVVLEDKSKDIQNKNEYNTQCLYLENTLRRLKVDKEKMRKINI